MLEPEISAVLRNQPLGAGGEIQVVDEIDSAGFTLCACWGKRYDCGSKFGYLEAIIDFAQAHKDDGSDFRNMVMDHVQQMTAEQKDMSL